MAATSRGIADYQQIWSSKPALRAVYVDFMDRLAAQCQAGRTLEIGAGGASLKSRLPNLIASDLQPASGLDVAADAQLLPFADACFDNIVMIDALHHLASPKCFFAEAVRVLRPGGRLLLLEPAITWLSRPLYGLFHHERVDMGADPFSNQPLCKNDDPYDANMAIPTLLFTRYRNKLHELRPELGLIELDWCSLMVYPLSGGYQPWCLIPAFAVPFLLRLDNLAAKFVGRWLGTRLLAVLERKPSHA